MIPADLERLALLAASEGLTQSAWLGRQVSETWTALWGDRTPRELQEQLSRLDRVRTAGGTIRRLPT